MFYIIYLEVADGPVIKATSQRISKYPHAYRYMSERLFQKGDFVGILHIEFH
jgi:hypothetical protein